MQSASDDRPAGAQKLRDLEFRVEASLTLADEIGAGLAAVYLSHALEIIRNERAFPPAAG